MELKGWKAKVVLAAAIMNLTGFVLMVILEIALAFIR